MRLDDLFIKTDYTTIYGKMAGDPSAQLVLGIHGWSQRNGWHTWEPLLAPIAEAGYCAVSIDMPGWGDTPAIDHLPLMGERAVDVVVEVMDKLMQETAVLMGKSWGGGVVINTALMHPTRISHLILTAPAFRDFEKLATLEQPVLLAWSKDDPTIPYGVSDEYMTHLSKAKRITYETGGHSAAPENAEDFAPKAIQFLKE
ncbi:MAG: alpha/beta hydrolase [Chloroflexota bacterium]